MRLNKFLSDAGVCSRREADRLVESGRVSIDGKPAMLGSQVEEHNRICIDGKEIQRQERKVLLLFHKPRGIECTADMRVKKNVISYVNYPLRVYYAGRLDKDSEGLLLLTNQGDLVQELMKAGNFHEKEYVVTVNKPVTEEFMRKIREGVPILGTVTRKCLAERVGNTEFRIVLTQGVNRQIRRTCEYLGYEVKRLKRVRIMNLELGELPVGQYREATQEELSELHKLLEKSQKSRQEGREKERYAGGKPVKNAGKYRTPSSWKKKTGKAGKNGGLKKNG